MIDDEKASAVPLLARNGPVDRGREVGWDSAAGPAHSISR